MTPRSPRPPLWAPALLLVVLVLALVACGGDDGEDDAGPNGDATAANPLADAAATTLDAGTARLDYDAAFEGPDGAFAFGAEGDVDYAERRSRLVYDLSRLPGSGGEEVEVRFDGPEIFVRFPPGSQDVRLPEGKEWIRMPPPETPAEGEEAPPQQIEIAGVQQDPSLFLRYLQSGATDVQEEGPEEVREVPTTVYTGSIDLERVLENGVEGLGDDDDERAVARARLEGLRDQLGSPLVPVTVNVDEEGLVRRMLLSFDLPTGARGQTVSALTTTEYFDFGAEVEVEPPSQAQVIDAADVE